MMIKDIGMRFIDLCSILGPSHDKIIQKSWPHSTHAKNGTIVVAASQD